jgi:hypothetical protein
MYLAIFATVFMFISDVDSADAYVSLFLPLFIIIRSARHFPKYASLRYFGDLARPEILDPMVQEAWVKYRNGKRRIDLNNEEDVKAIRKMYLLVVDESD